ncbi:MAG: hypothetical protein ACI8Y4_005270 [Candidatus Poriferisodalaceae bacterium]|jgi:hypothetical protein
MARDETQDPKTAAALLPSSSVRVCSSSRQEGAKSGEVTIPAATARPPRARSRSEYQGAVAPPQRHQKSGRPPQIRRDRATSVTVGA